MIIRQQYLRRTYFTILIIVIFVTFVNLISDPLDFSKYQRPLEVKGQGFHKGPLWKQNLYQEASQPNPSGKVFTKKFLTIGIATVYREEKYLKRTLESLISKSWPEERELVTIVLFLADTDEEKREMQFNLIEIDFQTFLNSGFIQIIRAPPSIYPLFDFALRKRTYDDSVDRVIWRTKQVIDFGFLFSYVRLHEMSEYHLIAEDDILASDQYITAIKDFVMLKKRDNSKWSALQFTTFLGIGLLFNTRQLEELSEFLFIFHEEHPVDILMKTFSSLQNPGLPNGGVILRTPSIFQHIGKRSTLPNKIQGLVDNTFGQGERKFKNHKNPEPLRMSTTLKIQGDFVPENAYSPAPGWFRGMSSSATDSFDSFDIIYSAPVNIKRIVVYSGSSDGPDRIKDGKLLIGSLVQSDEIPRICKNFKIIGNFKKGLIDIFLKNSTNVLAVVECIRIQISVQLQPIIITEIQVF